MEDDALMARVAAGDSRSFNLLVERHVDRVFRLALRILGNRADAEDIVQNAFLQVWTKAVTWRAGEGKVSTWLWRVVVNGCLSQRRKRSHSPLDEAAEISDPAPDVLTGMMAEQEIQRVEHLTSLLPERQRAALALVYGAGASNTEAAEALGVSTGALEQLLVRAKRTLRGQLAQEEG